MAFRCNHAVILNIAIADFMMGIYLITISIVHAMKYLEVLFENYECFILQCFALVSNDASCFLMVTFTAFRLFHVYRSSSSITAPTRPWKICIVTSWLVAGFWLVCQTFFLPTTSMAYACQTFLLFPQALVENTLPLLLP